MVAPTPPQGVLPPSAIPAPSAAAVAATHVAPDGVASVGPRPQRPLAPAISFSPRAEPALPSEVTCPNCGATNLSSVRFCVSCGYLVAGATPAPAAANNLRSTRGPTGTFDLSPPGPASKTSASPAPPRVEPSPPPLIAPAPVMGFATTEAAPVPRLCARCHAPADGGAQYCRLCGAPLASPAEHPPADRASAKATAPRASLVPLVPSAPEALPTGRLVLMGRDGSDSQSYPLGESTDIGRSEGAVLLADDRYIAPRHARIAFRAGSYFLRDLGTTNGVYIRIPFRLARRAGETDSDETARPKGDPEHTLEDQDLFLVGQQVLKFEVVKDAEEGFGVASDNGTLLFGTPATPRYARLSQRTVEGVARDVFNVRKAETVLGRESGDIVFADDPFLSRRHAMIRIYGTGPREGGVRRFSLCDLGSSNGTFLRVQAEVELQGGDQFRIGQQLFRFDCKAGVHSEGTKNSA